MNKHLPAHQFSRKSAFSLIEMAIVVLIIGVLVVGIVGGKGLIRAAVLNGARSFTAKASVPQIQGLVAWYETSLKDSLKVDEASDGNQISVWYDISPTAIAANKYDTTPGSATGQINVLSRSASSALLYQDAVINDIPALFFSGAGNLSLTNFYQGALTQSTIFLVFRPAALNTTLFDSDSSGSSASIGISSNTVNLNAGNAVSTGTGSNSAAFVAGQDYIVAVYLNGANSKAYVNNANTSAGNANIDAGTNSLTGLTIGSNKSSGSFFNGFISEVIIFDRPLPIQERRDIFKYLSYKYKISVSGI